MSTLGFAPVGPSATVSHILGEMVWLLGRSSIHAALTIGDLDWLIMPPLALGQFYLFREGDKPVGLALWAKCGPEAVEKLTTPLVSETKRLSYEDWQSGEEIWLIDLICPFATAENRQRDLMIADLIAKPLAGVDFRMHYVGEDGGRHIMSVDASARDQLMSALAKVVANGDGDIHGKSR